MDLAKAVLPAMISLGCLQLALLLRQQSFTQIYVALAAVSTALALLLLNPRRFGGDSQLTFDRGALILGTVSRWAALLVIIFSIAFVTKYTEDYSRLIIGMWALGTPVLLVAADLALYSIGRRLQLSEPNERTAVFAGCNEVSRQLASRIIAAPEVIEAVVDFLASGGAPEAPVSHPPSEPESREEPAAESAR